MVDIDIWHGVPSLATEVRCGDEVHTVRWVSGAVVFDAHPDPDAEAVLAALGGTPPECLAYARLWRDAVDDGGFLADWSEVERVDRLTQWRRETALQRLQREGVQDFLHGLPRARAERMGDALVRLPHGLQDRAALAVARRVIAAGAGTDPLLAGWLTTAIRLRARSAFVRSLAAHAPWCRPAALVPLALGVSWAAEARPAISGRLAGRSSSVELALSLGWLAEVWGRGLAVSNGRFVAGVDQRGDGSLVGQIVRWQPDGDGVRAVLDEVELNLDA